MQPWEEKLKHGFESLSVPENPMRPDEPSPRPERGAVWHLGKVLAQCGMAAVLTFALLFAAAPPVRDWSLGLFNQNPGVSATPLPSDQPAPSKQSPSSEQSPPADSTRVYWGQGASEHFIIECTADADAVFADAMETIYEDEYFRYSLSQITSMYYNILFDDGTRMPLLEALSSGRVTIGDCIVNKLDVFMEQKNGGSGFIMGDTFLFSINEQLFFPSIHFIATTMLSENAAGPTIHVEREELTEVLDNTGFAAAADSVRTSGEPTFTIGTKEYFNEVQLKNMGITIDGLNQSRVPISIQLTVDNVVQLPPRSGNTASEHFIIEFSGQGIPTAEAMEKIYEDAFFTYSFGSICSQYYAILFDDGTRMPLVEALSSGRVTIEDCFANGLYVHAETINRDGWLVSGNNYMFTLNDKEFHPSAYFVLQSNDSTRFRGEDLLEALRLLGFNDAADRLAFKMDNTVVPLVLGYKIYFNAEELKSIGITAHDTYSEASSFIKMRFTVDDYVGKEVSVHYVSVQASGGDVMQPYEAFVCSRHGDLFGDGEYFTSGIPLNEFIDGKYTNELLYHKFTIGYSEVTAALTGTVRSTNYIVYDTDTLSGTEELPVPKDGKLAIPQKLGKYIVRMRINWGVENNYTCYDYWFGVHVYE